MNFYCLLCDRERDGDVIDAEEFQGEMACLECINEYDPTPYCAWCGAMSEKACGCGPIAENN